MIRPSAIYNLMSCVPEWFAVRRHDSHEISGTATVPVIGAATDYVMSLTISGDAGTISVRETEPLVIPSFCPERHVNEDLSCCLGFGVEDVAARDEAVVWWELLRNYILLQRTASRTRRWPKGKEIAHGGAGKHHVRARQIAEQLCIRDEYDDAVAGGRHWCNDSSLRIAPGGRSLCNGRLRCPMGCPGRRGRPRLRRECLHREHVAQLVRLERLRQKAAQEFLSAIRRKGHRCCGALVDCPLADQAA